MNVFPSTPEKSVRSDAFGRSLKTPEAVATNVRRACGSGALIALAAVLGLGCARAPAPPRFQPYESVAQILADFELHRADDLYRFGYPRDLAGGNLFRVTLSRIDNYETLYPGQFTDILNLARAQLYERLGDYGAALKAYGRVGPNASAELRGAAEQGQARVRELADVAMRRADASGLSRYLADLETKRDDLNRLAEKLAGTPYQTLARMEAEKADVQRALLLFHNRYVLPGGLEPALKNMRDLCERHKDSHLANQHKVLLADFYFAAAKDCVALSDPDQLGFDAEQFESLVGQARELYFDVSQIDGAPEKLEARAKLQALGAFGRDIRDRLSDQQK
ncbi:MAG: hypothetical protein NTW86_13335 [Candidatus Sumerlaeota bacterium]|nr:hypothetical protein [Candidatus Sumerlaeota bacterium]